MAAWVYGLPEVDDLAGAVGAFGLGAAMLLTLDRRPRRLAGQWGYR